MSAFYIWHPYLLPDENQLALILINSNVSGIALDNAFAGQLLNDIGIEAEVIRWQFKPYRCLYYSEYLDEADWHDRWPLVWRVSVALRRSAPIKLTGTAVPWRSTNATGDNWLELPQDESIGCLVVSDFDDAAAWQTTIARLTDDPQVKAFQQKNQVGPPVFSRARVWGQDEQLQIDLGQFPETFFAGGAGYAEYVMQICRQQNGSTHHEAIPGKI